MPVMAPSVFRLRKILLTRFHGVQPAAAGQSGARGGRAGRRQTASDKSRASSSLHPALAFHRVSTSFLGGSDSTEAFNYQIWFLAHSFPVVSWIFSPSNGGFERLLQ